MADASRHMAGHRRARGPGLRGGVLACAVIACALFGSGMMVLAVATSAQAQSLKTQAKQAAGQADTSQPVLLTADEVTYDENLGTVTASGSVELSQGDRLLLADTVTYNQNADTVSASGNVSLLEGTGEVLFSNYVELRDAMKIGFVENLRLLLTDGSRFAANRAERYSGQKKVMDRAVFSPCQACKEDPNRPLLWQIKAIKVVHDEQRREIQYEDAVLEMFGIPVFYSPYLVHPDPTVKRRSGLLAPTLGLSSELGFIYGQPYFWAIDGSRDLELEPRYYSKEGGVIRGQYRQRFAKGAIDFKGSGAYIDNREGDAETGEKGFEGHADLEGRFDFDDTWRGGFDFEQSSRRTYIRRFRLDSKEVLTSRVYTEGFRERNYANISSYKFQGLRSGDDRSRSPIVAPVLNYNMVGEPDRAGGRYQMDATMMSLTRETGADSRKLAVQTGWSLPYIAPAGDVYKLSATVDTDIYYANDPTASSSAVPTDDETTGRIFPQLGLEWRYPFARRQQGYSQMIEPIVNLVAGPNGGNPDELPNEDSQAFLFDDTNLFRMNRFDGSDRVTSGSRVDYGMKFGVYGDRGGSTSLMLGQSYRFYGDSAFGTDSGLDEDLSDYVGRVHIQPTDHIDLLYRFQFDRDSLEPRRNEFGIRLIWPAFAFYADYVLLDDQAQSSGFQDREQFDTAFSVRLLEHWSVTGRLVQDLSNNENKTRIAGLGLVYGDECISVGLEFERRDLQDEDLKPEDRVFLRVNFKYLGAIESN
jgi:LPS-assembly protein